MGEGVCERRREMWGVCMYEREIERGRERYGDEVCERETVCEREI